MLTVKDLMTANPIGVPLETPLDTVISMMNRNGFRQLLILNQGKLVGIITNRDVRLVVNSPLIDKISERANFLEKHTVESCMTANPITVTADMPAAKVAEMLAVYKYGSFPVVENDNLVGIITVTDMLNYMAEALKE